MMSSYYHSGKETDMATMTEPLCLERGNYTEELLSIAQPERIIVPQSDAS